MSLSIGIVGLPNAGKSTLFNALVKRELAKVADYPFTTIDPHEAVVDIPDEKFDQLCEIVTPIKRSPASIKFVDIAGLVKGAHKGEGLGNEFLSHIREVDAILHLARVFEDPKIVHSLIEIDAVGATSVVETELILKDIMILDRILEEKKGTLEEKPKGIYEKVREMLDQGTSIRLMQLSKEELEGIEQLNLLSAKPALFVANLSEKQITEKNTIAQYKSKFLVISAKLEAELSNFEDSEQKEYLEQMEIKDTGFTQILKKAYELLDLITFYTIKGGKEVKAYPVKKGTDAVSAAERVHTDIARGFIKAEVINADELLKIGSWQKASDKGKIRLEGRDYEIQDRDVVEFKFRK